MHNILGASICAFVLALIVATVYAAIQHRWKIFTKLVLLFAGTAICMAASGGCGTDLHRAAIASGSIAASLNTAAEVNHTNTFETPQERVLVANSIIQVAVANNNFISVLQSAESNGGSVTSAQVETAFSSLVTQVNQLNTLGVLKLKSPNAQAAFSVVMASIQGELSLIQSLTGSSTAISERAVGGGGISAAAISFTPAEIEELIALAISAGSALLPKLLAMKGETDAEVLAAAQSDDTEAISQAEADGGSAPVSEVPVEGAPVASDPEAEDTKETSVADTVAE